MTQVKPILNSDINGINDTVRLSFKPVVSEYILKYDFIC